MAAQHFPNHWLRNNARNTWEDASVARALDFLLQDEGFAWMKFLFAVEVMARQLYDINMAMAYRIRHVAGHLEENSNSHSMSVQDTQLWSYNFFKPPKLL